MKTLFRPQATPPWLFELVRFGLVGVAGFVVNAVGVALIAKITNLYLAGLLSWVVAATVTWFLNRIWTFAEREHVPMWRQWLHFLGANFFGLILYYATYAAAIFAIPQCAAHPVGAVAAGSLAGLIANFTLSKRLVFR